MNEHKTKEELGKLIEGHADAHDHMRAAFFDMMSERDEAKASYASMQKDRDFVMEQLAVTRKLRDDALAAHNALKNATARRAETASEREAVIRRTQLHLDELVEQVKVAEAKLVDLRSKLSHQVGENEALRKTLLDARQEHADLLAASKVIAERRDELQALIGAHTKKYDEMQRYLSEGLDERNGLRELNTNQRATILKLQAMLNDKSVQCNEQASAASAGYKRIIELRDEKLTLETTVHALRKRLKDAKPEAKLEITQREYLRHELMDRAHVIGEMFGEHVSQHPALHFAEGCYDVESTADLAEKIEAAERAIQDVYQTAAELHL